ncbi:sugar phosphate isomerase/epimerase family protein [Plantactinospora sp. CA-290183]|uniref:sugar phosphate isomerase/epimerase family protein n=1 Tax=Plantactinospora sp. CA-290183 TaxID=3240006 RepID=UPI003D938AE5
MGTDATPTATTDAWSRRGFLGLSACAAASAISLSGPFTGVAQAAEGGAVRDARGTRLPVGRIGIQLYSVRTDPAPFAEKLPLLAGLGFKEIEFAGYGNGTPTDADILAIRKILDDNGLKAVGSHVGFDALFGDLTRQLDIAQMLGMKHIGTANAPTGSRYRADWRIAADRYNAVGGAAKARGLKFYQHNHDGEYNFLLDTGPLDAGGKPTRSTGQRGLEYFFGLTQPDLVYFEMDIYWAYQAQVRFKSYLDEYGVTRRDTFDPIRTISKQQERFPLFHVKDGVLNAEGTSLTMTEYGVPGGYVPFEQFFASLTSTDAHHYIWEQDNAGTTPPEQGGVYGAAERSYDNMRATRF